MMRCCSSPCACCSPAQVTLEKTLQVYEMMIVRHGFMLVGMPWSGKTVSRDVLTLAMRTLHERHPEDDRWAIIHHVVINPKAVTMGSLYGKFDEVRGRARGGGGARAALTGDPR